MDDNRNTEIITQCPICGKQHKVLVREEDWELYNSPDRPRVQDIFPYLSPAERELLITGIDDKCFHKMFEGEDYE